MKKKNFYSQHWTRLANSQTNTIPRLELPKHGLQIFFERDPHMLEHTKQASAAARQSEHGTNEIGLPFQYFGCNY